MNLTYKYLKKVIKNIANKQFKEFIVNYDTNPFLIQFEQLGNQNADKNIYIIENDDASHGFFAEYRMTINYLAFADRYHFLPYVFYNKNYAYSEKEKILGTNNPFEYYFEQISNLSYESIYSSKNVIFAKNAHGDMIESLNKNYCAYEISDVYIEHAAKIVKKYIRFNSETKRYLKQAYNTIFLNCEGLILGIHYRGTDFKQNFDRHPIAINLKQLLEKTREAIALKGFSYIFLATDDKNAIEEFEKEFGNKVLYYKDVFRGTSEVSVAFSECKREKHHYYLGLEVLRDMYTLAKCDGLIAGLSQVSNMARVNKKAWGETFAYEYILDKGINHNKKKFV